MRIQLYGTCKQIVDEETAQIDKFGNFSVIVETECNLVASYDGPMACGSEQILSLAQRISYIFVGLFLVTKEERITIALYLG